MYMASTQISWLDIRGRSISDASPAPTSRLSHQITDTNPPRPPVKPAAEERTRVPSLLELALRAAYTAPNLAELPFLLDDLESVPRPGMKTHLHDLLKRTFKLQQSGGQECTICKRGFIVPRTEWIEWWGWVRGFDGRIGGVGGVGAIVHEGGRIPFLRRGCSWACFEEREDAVYRGWECNEEEDDEGA